MKFSLLFFAFAAKFRFNNFVRSLFFLYLTETLPFLSILEFWHHAFSSARNVFLDELYSILIWLSASFLGQGDLHHLFHCQSLY